MRQANVYLWKLESLDQRHDKIYNFGFSVEIEKGVPSPPDNFTSVTHFSEYFYPRNKENKIKFHLPKKDREQVTTQKAVYNLVEELKKSLKNMGITIDDSAINIIHYKPDWLGKGNASYDEFPYGSTNLLISDFKQMFFR